LAIQSRLIATKRSYTRSIDWNLSKISYHDVETDECEWVVRKHRPAQMGRKLVVVGRTKRGRRLKVVFEMDDEITAFVITAYDV